VVGKADRFQVYIRTAPAFGLAPCGYRAMKPSDGGNNSRGSGGEIQEIGLCVRCAHAIPMAGPRSAFVRCGLAGRDPRYPRYPILPVTSCPGFGPRAGGA